MKQRVSPYVLVVSIFIFSVSAGSCDGLLHTVLLELSLLVDAGCSASCDEDVDDVGEDELEELVDRPGTTIGTLLAVLNFIRLPSSMSCGFWPVVHSWDYP